MVVYKITNKINNKIYIGQTKNFKIRKRQHLKLYKNNKNSLIDLAINKYGSNNFEWEVLKECQSQDELNFWETYYIEKFNATDLNNGYNLKGGGAKPWLSEETKRKIGDSQKGKLNHMYNKKSKENKSSKPLINLTLNIKYDSVMQCAKKENKSFSHIAAVCRGVRGTCGGCVYRYLDKNNQIIEPKYSKAPHRKLIRCVETNVIYQNCNDAKRKLGYGTSKHNEIHDYFYNRRKLAYGCHWEYC